LKKGQKQRKREGIYVKKSSLSFPFFRSSSLFSSQKHALIDAKKAERGEKMCGFWEMMLVVLSLEVQTFLSPLDA
jgi:hypothetical protein